MSGFSKSECLLFSCLKWVQSDRSWHWQVCFGFYNQMAVIPRSSVGLARCLNWIKLVENWVTGACLELVAFGIWPQFLVASSTCQQSQKNGLNGLLCFISKSLVTILVTQKLNDLPPEYTSVKCCYKQELFFCLVVLFCLSIFIFPLAISTLPQAISSFYRLTSWLITKFRIPS